MSKLGVGILFFSLACAGVAAPSAATMLPGPTGGLGCDVYIGGKSAVHDGGFFGALTSCAVAGATGSIVTAPYVLMQVNGDAGGLPPVDRNSVNVLLTLSYYFTVTGGAPGDLVPVLVHTIISTTASPSVDGNNGNGAFTAVELFRVGAGFQRVALDKSLFICTVSPTPNCSAGSFDGDLSLMLPSGSVEEIYLQLSLGASATSAGTASGTIDPYIYVDPTFAGAGQYSIEVSPGVGNSPVGAIPGGVPEPATWGLMLVGFSGLGAVLRRRRSRTSLIAA